MIAREELLRLLADTESDRIERTESVGETDKFADAITAFANDLPNHGAPGYLVVGARDDGSLNGLTVTDQLLLSLANEPRRPQPFRSDRFSACGHSAGRRPILFTGTSKSGASASGFALGRNGTDRICSNATCESG